MSTQSAREHELAILYELTSLTKYSENQDRVIELTLDKASRLLGAEIVAFYLWNAEQDQLEVCAARGVTLKRLTSPLRPEPHQLEGINVAAGGMGTVLNPLGAQYPLRAALSLPLNQLGVCLGWLFVGRLRRERFEDQELSLYTVLAEQVASALHMTLAWTQQRRQQAELEAAKYQLEQLVAELSATSQRQTQLLMTVRALSSPVLLLEHQVLLMPLIGLIDDERAALIQEHVLTAITRNTALVVILDLSGIANVDEHVVKGLVQTAQAAGLLGARMVLCGISPEVAQVMVSLNLHMPFSTTQNLRNALALAFKLVRA